MLPRVFIHLQGREERPRTFYDKLRDFVELSGGRLAWLTLDRNGAPGGIGSAFGPSLVEELTRQLGLAPGSALLSPRSDPQELGLGGRERRGAGCSGTGWPRPVVSLCGDERGAVCAV